MKQNNYKVEDLSPVQMNEIHGGSWLGDAFRWAKEHFITRKVEMLDGTTVRTYGFWFSL
ncbi:hypothetical protein QUF70_08705 [Desulfobacterales bacterium HSG17]|nr:hypothetical protein [Desulfobacterales bacterium HSG17]